MIGFHGLQDSAEPTNAGHSQLIVFLSIAELHTISLLKQDDDPAQHIPKRPNHAHVTVRYLQGTGILTCFPFVCTMLWEDLGSTYSQLISVAEKPWPIRRKDLSSFYAVTCDRIFIPTRSTRFYNLASVLTGRLLTPTQHS